MKMNKIISCIIALTMIISMFSVVTVSAASLDGLVLDYSFANEKDGDADGTITISGITAELQTDITNVDIYWGKNDTEKMDNYYNLANYTVDGFTVDNKDFDATELVCDDETLTYTLKNARLIPEGATHVIADVTTANSGTTKLVYEIPAGKRLAADKSEMLYNMIWASDFHAENTAYKEDSHSSLGIKDFVRLAAMGREVGEDKFKGLIFNGDIANSAIDYEYALIEDSFVKYGVDFPVYYVSGNHDTAMFSNGVSMWDECAKAFDVRFKKLEEDFGLTFDRSDPWSYETTIEGQHYIFLSTPYKDNYSLSASQAKWLEEKLCYYEKSGEPTYIFTHMPWKSSGHTRVDQAFADSEFNKIIERHPSAIVITGHVHQEPDSDMISYNIADVGDTPVIDTCAVTYTNAYTPANEKASGRGGYCKYLEFYPDRIIMRTRDVRNQIWVAKTEHIIYVDNYDKKFEGTFTIDYDDTLMSAGEVLTAKLNGAELDTNAYSINWYDMSGNLLQAGGSTYTVITANASVSAQVTTADGAYAWAVARYIAPVVDDGEDDEDEEPTVDPSDNLDFSGTTTVKYYGDVVYLYGAVDSAYAGQDATMVLMSKTDYPDMSKAKYFGTCPITSTGDYMFKFKASDVEEDDIFIVKVGNENVVANYVSQKGSNEEIVEVIAEIDDDNVVSLKLHNKYADAMNAKIILAMYDSATNELIKAKPIDYELAFAENGEIQQWYSEALESESEAYVKIFLWTNLVDLVPLSTADDKVTLPKITVEETTTTETVTE